MTALLGDVTSTASTPPSERGSAAISIKGAVKRFGEITAVDGLDLDVPRGICLGLLGPNGAGKSTSMRMLTGQVIANEGEIRVFEHELPDDSKQARARMGVVPQLDNLDVDVTVEDNLEMGAMLPRARARARQTRDEVYAMFPRLAERRGQTAGTMSGGEQQMLAIGRCLMGNPELVMFDEPSLGLAPTVVQEVLHTIRLLHDRGLTILLVEQNVAVSLKLSQHAFVLENGHIVMSGSGEQLLRDDRVRQAYLGL